MKRLIFSSFALACMPAWSSVPVPELVELPGTQRDLQQYNYHQTADGKMAVFAQSEKNFQNAQIMLAQYRNNQWQPVVAAPFSQSEFIDTDPYISADGSQLLFISDRAKTQGHAHALDIFTSKLIEGNWSKPQQLNDRVNSPAIELGPEQQKEKIYFSSTRPSGPGALAVYQYDINTKAAPVALPEPVNQGQQNSDFTISPDGKHALWWSTRAGAQPQLYVSTITSNGFESATLLPEPVNSAAGEITPNFTPDGQWLYFASDRNSAQGLYKLYKVSWPELLDALSQQNTTE